MSKAAFEVKWSPLLRDVEGKFTKATKKLMEKQRRELRPQARRLVGLMQEEAPSRSGAFKAKIRYQTFTEGSWVGFKVLMPQPLATFIIRGTRPHPIVARRAKSLRFFWEKGPKGPGIYFYFAVRHLGTKPNRFAGRAVRRWRPGARVWNRSLARSYIQELTK